jgi:hypothetical protein
MSGEPRAIAELVREAVADDVRRRGRASSAPWPLESSRI